ncbi:hypothetical protein HYU89_01460 [Candidatus Collierbacteria bacterium]|nr:hypothetical protein [Candidatus Collierbacteria bacterium]
MLNTDSSFYGQQTDERILYVVRSHWLSQTILFGKFLAGAAIVFFIAVIIGGQGLMQKYAGQFGVGGGIIAGAITAIGFWVVGNARLKNIAYITDRRVVKFEVSTPFATNIRSLNWEEAVKVKTYAPNMIWKQLMIGSVVVHAKTTIATPEVSKTERLVTDDDVEIQNAYFYRDLGNYIEKILFLYKKQPKDIESLLPFVPKKKGKRY